MTRLRVLTPSFKPAGGVVKIFDYVAHALTSGLEPIVYCPEPMSRDLPIFSVPQLSDLPKSVRFEELRTLRVEDGDLVLFSWPTHYELVAERAVGRVSHRSVIHLVQGRRHGDPSWLKGYASRLLSRPLLRIMLAEQIRAACEPFLNKQSRTVTIVEGHNWSYFVRDRKDSFMRPIRVAYTTWKSDVGPRVERMLGDREVFVFRSISETVGWSELRDMYQWADVFLACPGPQEGFYLPGIEAMAAGAVVVIPDVGGNMEYCEFGRNCVGVKYDDEASYLDALKLIAATSDQEINSIRQAALETLANHTLERERIGVGQLLDSLRLDPPAGAA